MYNKKTRMDEKISGSHWSTRKLYSLAPFWDLSQLSDTQSKFNLIQF